jgi:SAM-dependent methyltransferase
MPSTPRPAIDLGDLRRNKPFPKGRGGAARGTSVDRLYIDRFYAARAADIRGDVVEIGSATYTERHGGDRVASSTILDYSTANRRATLIGDLASAESLPKARFDCFIAPQTLQFTFDIAAAVRTMARMLRPGGVVLATLATLAPIKREQMDREGDYWRATSRAARRLFAEHFPPRRMAVAAHGNLIAATALLYGLAVEDLAPRDLTRDDPDYEVIITVRAVKA